MTAALTRRVADLPPLAKLAAKARQDYGDAYCGGQIEASLRKVLDARHCPAFRLDDGIARSYMSSGVGPAWKDNLIDRATVAFARACMPSLVESSISNSIGRLRWCSVRRRSAVI